MKTLTYDDLYSLSEELLQLKGGVLQAVGALNERFIFDLRLDSRLSTKESRWLILDLTPSQPFIVSTSSTKMKGPKRVTPALNFLRAHFVGCSLTAIEVAQKPNRTIRLVFEGENGTKTVLFKCFPHGQHLVLASEGKIVQYPLRRRSDENEVVSYVEPETVASWTLNDDFARALFHSEARKTEPKEELVPYHNKLIKRLEKAVQSIDQGVEKNKAQDSARMEELSVEALNLKVSGNVEGVRLQKLYDEIKKLKRKALLTATRRNELMGQIEKIHVEAMAPGAEKGVSTGIIQSHKQGSKNQKDKKLFSGTRIRLDEQFELWVGRSDWQNDDLVRLASPHELWIHLRDYPGAHGVIRGPKKMVPTFDKIEFSCRIVAILSASKKRPFAEGESLDFIVTPKKFVKKPKGAPPGRVIVERETIRRVAFKSVKFEVD